MDKWLGSGDLHCGPVSAVGRVFRVPGSAPHPRHQPHHAAAAGQELHHLRQGGADRQVSIVTLSFQDP